MNVLLKKWWFWGIAAATLTALVLLVFFQTRDTGPIMITEKVVRGPLRQTVEVSGQVESLSEIELGFETNGTIERLFVKVGDQVQAGDLLAVLERADTQAQLEKTIQTQRVAQANLHLKNTGPSDQTIEVSQAQVAVAQSQVFLAESNFASAQKDFETTQAVTAASVASAQATLKKAEDDFDQLVRIQAQTMDQIQEDFIGVFRASMIAARSGLSEADEILGIDNSLVNDEFENVLSNLDESQEDQAIAVYEKAKTSLEKTETLVYALTTESSFTQIDSVYPYVIDALDDVALTLLYTRKALDSTTLTGSSFTAAELSALESSIELAQENVETALNNTLAQQQLRDGTQTQQQADALTAENAVFLASEDFQSVQAQKIDTDVAANSAFVSAQNTHKIRQAELQTAQAQLAELTAAPRSVDLEPLEAAVDQAAADVFAAQIQLSKMEIRSPISGELTNIFADEGELVKATVPVLVVQTTQDAFQIIADIPESDIAKVSVGQQAEITVDAFGEDVNVAGTVVHIDPAQKEIEGIIFYELTIFFDTAIALPPLRPGLSADLIIITAQKDEALSIPARAVLQKEGKEMVRVKIEDEIQEREVLTGLRAEDGRIEIMAGLEEGEEVIVSLREQ